MTERWKSKIARRPFLAGLLGIFGVGVVGGAIYETPKLFKRYPPTPYDDLLELLPDREEAIRLGAGGLSVTSGPTVFEPEKVARDLRKAFAGRSLREAMEADLEKHAVAEFGGWVLPLDLTLLCEFAAKVSRT